MDPKAEAEQAASQLLKTSFITVILAACHGYNTEKKASVNNIQFSLPDPTEKTVKISHHKKKKKTVYLTFDDGPNKGTRKVMHIAQEEKMPITMFIIGEHVYGCTEQKETYDSISACGFIEIANHSFSHANHNRFAQFYDDPDIVVKDFIQCADSLNLSTHIIRTPGRNIWRTEKIQSTDLKNSTEAADSLQSNGFIAIGWDIEWHFDNDLKLQNTGDEMIQQIDSAFAKGKTKTSNHLVLLAHDQIYAKDIDSIELHNFMKRLKMKDEYNFEVISNYPN